MAYESLAQGLKGIAPHSDGPPEPPTHPFDGPVFEKKGDSLYCLVPGCSKKERPFEEKHAIAVHMARRHGLNLEGKPARAYSRASVTPSPPPPPPKPPISVKGIIVGTEGSLVAQAIRIVETAKVNLGGKLTDMHILKEKAERLEVILGYMRELV